MSKDYAAAKEMYQAALHLEARMDELREMIGGQEIEELREEIGRATPRIRKAVAELGVIDKKIQELPEEIPGRVEEAVERAIRAGEKKADSIVRAATAAKAAVWLSFVLLLAALGVVWGSYRFAPAYIHSRLEELKQIEKKIATAKADLREAEARGIRWIRRPTSSRPYSGILLPAGYMIDPTVTFHPKKGRREGYYLVPKR